MLIFGSRAMKNHFSDAREPKGDIDVIDRNAANQKSSRLTEYHWTPAFQYVLDYNKDSQYVAPDFLYTIKVSHAAWNIHWDKTMHDIMFLQNKGCKLDIELFNLLIPEWEVKHGKKRVNLNKENYAVFDDAVTRKFDHDELHKMLAFYNEPLHTKIRFSETNALPSETLFNQLSYEDQLKCALEEAYVIAVERYIIPDPKMPVNHAKYKALKQLITSMTKGWFNLFLIVNFEKLVYYKDENMNAKIKGIICG